jgi:hypothetical protein
MRNGRKAALNWRKNGMSREKIVGDASLIFQSAEAFLNACRTLDADIKRGNRFILPIPMAVNSALALELFLKCLCTVESGFFFKGHEFDDQYLDLPQATKDELRRRHEKAEANDPFFAKMRKDKYKTDLDSLLKMGKKTFVHFRYAFEKQTVAQKTVWALDNFMLDVRDIILEKRPEWTPQGYPPPRAVSNR